MKERHNVEKFSRAAARSAYCGDHTALCRVLGQFMMYVDTRDSSISPHLMLNGYWESWVTRAIAEYVKPGMICVDAGAACGYFTLVMAERVGPEGHVYCFEPNPRSMELIQKSLDINGFLDRVTLIQKAVSDSAGTANLLFGNAHPPSGSIMAEPGTVHRDEQIESIIVETVRLDDVIEGKLDFIKADVEGAEIRMFKGMQECLERNPQLAMCVEYGPAFYSPATALPLAFINADCEVRQVASDGSIAPFTVSEATDLDQQLWMLWVTRNKS